MRTLSEGASPETRPRSRPGPDLHPIGVGLVIGGGVWLFLSLFMLEHPHTATGDANATRDGIFATVLILGGLALRGFRGSLLAVIVCAAAGIGLALAALFLPHQEAEHVFNEFVTGVVAALGAFMAGAAARRPEPPERRVRAV